MFKWKFYKNLEFLKSGIVKSLDGKKEKEWKNGHIDREHKRVEGSKKTGPGTD